jgi:hypothetical protein
MTGTDHSTNSIRLGEHETTGLLPVGFEFERQGGRYDHFDVSSDGFITFTRSSGREPSRARIRLAGEPARLGGGSVRYEVRGQPPRRRLVVSVAPVGPEAATLLVTVHERTGIVEVGPTGQSFGEPTIRQLDRFQSSASRVNSARKIG